MESKIKSLQDLFDRIPRRHSVENVHDINSILNEYEDVLISIESENAFYEENTPPFFDELEQVRSAIKNSNSNKASKKMKDNLFDEGSGNLKDSMQALLDLCSNGK